MMMRADKSYEPVCTPEQMVACAFEDDPAACLAACSGNEEPEEEDLPGYAKVSTKAAAAQTVALNAVDKKVWTVTLKAGENDTTVTAIEITKAGLWAATDVATISLMKNGEYVTNSATLTNKVAKLRFRPSLTLKANGSETFDVVVSMAWSAGWAQPGGQHEFSVTAVTVSNGTFGWTPAKLGSLTTTNYDVESLTVKIWTESADAGDEDTEIATVNLKSAKADATVNSVTLIAENMTDSWSDIIANAKAYIDDEVVWTVTVNEETIVVNGLNEKIKKWKDIDVVIKADVIYVGTMATPLSLDAEHVVAYEDNTNERMSLNVTKWSFNVDNWIGLTLTNNVKKTQKVVKDAEDVVLMDIDVESAADIEVLDYTLKFRAAALTADDQLEDVRVSVDGDEFDLPMSLFDTNADHTVDAWNINLADKYLNAFTIDAWKKVNIKVLATTKKDADDGNGYQITLDINKIKSIDTKNTITWTPLDTEDSHLTEVADASFVITQKSTDGNTIKIWEAKDVLSFTAKAKSEDLKIKDLIFVIDSNIGTLNDVKNAIDKVTVDGKTVLAKDLKLWSICYDGSDATNYDVVYWDNDDCSDDSTRTTGYTTLDDNFLYWEVTLNKTIKDWETTTYTLSLKTAGDIAASLLGKNINISLPMFGLHAKWVTSDNDVYSTKVVEWKDYQIVITKPSIELSQNGKFITVTVNNEADYNVKLESLALEVLSERNDNWTELLPKVTTWNIRENTSDGTILATESNTTKIDSVTNTTWLPWVFTLDFTTLQEVAEWEPMTFVIEMVSTVNIKSTDYTVAAKSFSYRYRDEDATPSPTWWTQIDENY